MLQLGLQLVANLHRANQDQQTATRISRRRDIPWPPGSPDLSPIDFFLWGYLKTKDYETNPRSIDELKGSIRREMLSITELTWKILFIVYRYAKNEMEHI